MKMVSITGETVRVAHVSGHILDIGEKPVDVSEEVNGLVEHALSCGCMPYERLQKAVAERRKKDVEAEGAE